MTAGYKKESRGGRPPNSLLPLAPASGRGSEERGHGRNAPAAVPRVRTCRQRGGQVAGVSELARGEDSDREMPDEQSTCCEGTQGQGRRRRRRSQRGFSGQRWDPGLEIEVPFEQRPVNEYSSLKSSLLYSWGELSPGSFFLRLGSLWLITFTVLGAPIAAASFNPSKDPLKFVLSAGIGTLLLVSIVVLRIYLGWSYVGDRLLSAVIPYEESGWYDGQMWVKPPEVLARDRLLGSYKVKPVIKLLKRTLLGTGILLATAVSLLIFATPVENFLQSLSHANESGLVVSAAKAPDLKKEELLRLPVEVMNDDDLAAAAAEAADGRPVYCRSRLYRALAGGQYCKWDDLLN